MFSIGEMRTRRGDGVAVDEDKQGIADQSQGRAGEKAGAVPLCHLYANRSAPSSFPSSLHPYKNACETKHRLFRNNCAF